MTFGWTIAREITRSRLEYLCERDLGWLHHSVNEL